MAHITIGKLGFSSKEAARKYFRRIRDAYRDGANIVGADAADLCELISCHPEAEQKIGGGVLGFSVARDKEHGTRHFIIIREDRSSTDFSFLSCIDGANLRKDQLTALRMEIEDQIIAFRDMVFLRGKVKCPVLNVELQSEQGEVDHAPPQTFAALVKDWMMKSGINFESLLITPPRDNQSVARMTDEKQRLSWSEFHRNNAKLRILSKEANRAHTKK